MMVFFEEGVIVIVLFSSLKLVFSIALIIYPLDRPLQSSLVAFRKCGGFVLTLSFLFFFPFLSTRFRGCILVCRVGPFPCTNSRRRLSLIQHVRLSLYVFRNE